MSRDLHDELRQYLSDLYSMELQALAQLETAPGMAGERGLSADLSTHFAETEGQAERVRERLEAAGGSPSAVKDAVMKLGGKAFLLFAKVQDETPGRLLVHSYSYEAMEWAGYGVLENLARRAGDESTAAMAREIRAEERMMMDRLESRFSPVEALAHESKPPAEMGDHLHQHLAEAHALFAQNIEVMEQGEKASGGDLGGVYRRGAEMAELHLHKFRDQLKRLGAEPSWIEDVAMKIGGLNWGVFFRSQKDTPAKLLCFAYAVEHLVIGGLEMLERTARRAGDASTERLCGETIAEKRELAGKLVEHMDPAVSATLGITSD